MVSTFTGRARADHAIGSSATNPIAAIRRMTAARQVAATLCLGVLSFVVLATALSCFFAQDANAFPLWPKSKNQVKDQDKNQDADQNKDKSNDQRQGQNQLEDKSKDETKDQSKDQSKDQGKGRLPRRVEDLGIPPEPNADAASTAAATNAAIDAQINKLEAGQPSVPVDFVPSVNAGGSTNASGGVNDGVRVTVSQDPMAIYRKCGVNPVEERKIRALAQDFEGMQRVRLKLLMNLLADLRQYELQTDPDPKAVMAKQEEINKVTDQMVVERMKLLLSIRDVMTFDEKQRLVETLQRERR